MKEIQVLRKTACLIHLAKGNEINDCEALITSIHDDIRETNSDFAKRQKHILDKICKHYKITLMSEVIGGNEVIENQAGLQYSAKDARYGDITVKRIPCTASEAVDKSLLRLLESDCGVPFEGITLVAACMNREANLLKVLPSWLDSEADEIIIVDWSSRDELRKSLSEYKDARLKIIRIDGEDQWILTHALNVGLRFASHELVYKLDCDIELSKDFLSFNSIRYGEFIRGFWKLGLEQGGEGQQYINGTFGAFKTDLRAINYYDERILSYGWDDSDIYTRLSHNLGLAGKLIIPSTIRHLKQTKEQRLENQNVPKNYFLGKYQPTEFEAAKNKYYSMMAGDWGGWFPSQNYELVQLEPSYFRGIRITEPSKRNAECERLAEVLAIRQLALWAAPSMPAIGGMEGFTIEFARLLLDTHKYDKSFDFIEAIERTEAIYFIHCEDGPCRSALLDTLKVIRSHCASFDQYLFVIEGVVDKISPINKSIVGENILIADRALISTLIDRSNSVKIEGIEELERLIESGSLTAGYLSISVGNLVLSLTRKALKFASALGTEFTPLPAPISRTCLVTSLYDESNLIRLIEYSACLKANLEVFEQIVVYYEAKSGLLASLLHSISQTMGLAPGRLSLVPYQIRPTFVELFSIKDRLPSGIMLSVANADIVFDASLSKISKVDLTRTVVVLSRRDVSPDGKHAHLIRLENGNPNTFSEDAWIVETPFEPDFLLDYPIGTMHCDSFINHQLSKSKRYDVINPCFDIKIFHLHDERFNSSSEKAKRDHEQIKRNYNAERERNNGEDPVKGVAWCTLESANIVPGKLKAQQWCPKVLVLNLAGSSSPGLGHLLIMHQVYNTPDLLKDVVLTIKLRERDIQGALGNLLARYQIHFGRDNLLLDIKEDVDTQYEAVQGTVCRSVSFDEVASWIIDRDDYFKSIYPLLAWPSAAGIKLLRCEVIGDLSTRRTTELFHTLWEYDSYKESLLDFYNSLEGGSAEMNLLVPYIIPMINPPATIHKISAMTTQEPSVSFISSIVNGGPFLQGYLENVYYAAKQVGGEVIIIDANTHDDDARVINSFLNQHKDARKYFEYLHLQSDPGLYECWKIAIERSRADLVTNANVDDRRCPFHDLYLVSLLSQYPEISGACGSISAITDEGNSDWYSLQDNTIWFYKEGLQEIHYQNLYRRNEHGEIISRNIMHCMPMWRKRLHDQYGFFDEETYGTSADWAFWLKCANAGEIFRFEDRAFGRYFINPNSHNRRNDAVGVKERRIIKDLIGVEQDFFEQQ